jgi:hypothetical protein
MKYLRPAAILLLVLYSGLVVGANYHSHSQDPQVSIHCKICDFSQTYGMQPAPFSVVDGISPLGMAPDLFQASHLLDPQTVMPGRSPPLG